MWERWKWAAGGKDCIIVARWACTRLTDWRMIMKMMGPLKDRNVDICGHCNAVSHLLLNVTVRALCALQNEGG
jgi:hypothetical protein